MQSSHKIRLLGVFVLCVLLIGQIVSAGRAAPISITSPLHLGSAVGDLQSMAVRFSGPLDLVTLVGQNSATPLSLAAADFDEDGIQDVVTSYTSSGGGLLGMQRGNPAAIYPHGAEARAMRSAGIFTEAPLLPDMTLTGLPETPDFVAAGYFNSDNHTDVLVGASGSETLYLLAGDGHGGLGAPQVITLPGQLTGLLTGDFDAPDSLPEVIVSLNGADGPQIAIYASHYGALTAESGSPTPVLVNLPAVAIDMAIGHFEGDPRPSLAVLAGRQLVLLHGRSISIERENKSQPINETLSLPFQPSALAAGSFSGQHHVELAILASDGSLFLASPQSKNWQSIPAKPGSTVQQSDRIPTNLNPQDSQTWAVQQISKPTPLADWQIWAIQNTPVLSPVARLVRVQAAAGSADGLAVVTAPAAGADKTRSAGGETAPASMILDLSGSTSAAVRIPAAVQLPHTALPPLTAALSLRLSPAARQGLITLSTSDIAPQALLPNVGATFVVNTNSDAGDSDLNDGICDTLPDHKCSLRAAIMQANHSGGATINFNIPGSLPVIQPASGYEVISAPMVIDGTTQPGYAGTPLITLSGGYSGSAAHKGPVINSPSTVRGLIINNFYYNGLQIYQGAGGSIIENNYIGTDSTGTLSVPNGKVPPSGQPGLYPAIVVVSANNVIGGVNPAAHNLISGNEASGIGLLEADSHDNQVVGNYIGTDATGLAPLGNGQDGIAIDCSAVSSLAGHDNVIGGLSPGALNVISGNQNENLIIECASANANQVLGNFIGTNGPGMAAINSGQNVSGVYLWAKNSGSVRDNLIGGWLLGARNFIAGNTGNGVSLAVDSTTVGISVTHNLVVGNSIGVNVLGAVLPNQGNGIHLFSGADGNQIGDVPSSAICTGGSNVISGNLLNGVAISGARDNQVQGNCVGTAPNGTTLIPNGKSGVRIDQGSQRNLVGGDRLEGSCRNVCNTIAGNTESGIIVADSGTLSNTLRANDIHNNKLLGINLIGADDRPDGVTPNNPNSALPVRPNSLTYFPVGVTAIFDPAYNRTLISGVLANGNAVSSTIDLYASSQVNHSGFGEGEYYLGKVKPVATGVFTASVPGQLPLEFVSATATDAGGSTSEFGPVCGDPDGNGSSDDDGDGLCDDWEKYGIDFNGDGLSDLQLWAMGANPERKDIFIEADYMNGQKPREDALERVVKAFAMAPVQNPLGGGTGITLHFVGQDNPGGLDNPAGHLDEVLLNMADILFYSRDIGFYDDFMDIKYGHANTPCGTAPGDGHFGTLADRDPSNSNCPNIIGAKMLVFRYLVFGDTFQEGSQNSGVAKLPGQNIFVTVTNPSWRSWARIVAATYQSTIPVEMADIQAGTTMHELGHSLGLHHGGLDNVNCKPNYLSIMNYLYQFNDGGLPLNVPGVANGSKIMRSDRPLDYSRSTLPDLVKTALNEAAGIGGPAGRLAFFGGNGLSWLSPANGPIDWNNDTKIYQGILSAFYDINFTLDSLGGCPAGNPPDGTPLKGYDDWANLVYSFRNSTSYVHNTNRSQPGPRQPQAAILSEVNLTQFVNSSLGSADYDKDGIGNMTDNCPILANPSQTDSNQDGVGDVCSLANLKIGPAQTYRGQVITGTVSLLQPAPAGGAYLEVDTSVPGPGLPLTMTIPANATQYNFQFTAPNVTITTVVTVTANWASSVLSTTLRLVPHHWSMYLPVVIGTIPIPPGMGYVPAGSFQMGCDQPANMNPPCNFDAKPIHTVYLDTFFIDKYEVTNAQYAQCLAASACSQPAPNPYFGDPAYANSAVIMVNWAQADTFCKWKGKRLPTEAEWEKGARTPYAMLDGGKWEWVSDWYDQWYYTYSPVNNPTGGASGLYKVMRGGPYFFNAGWFRYWAYPQSYGPSVNYDFGIRCAQSR